MAVMTFPYELRIGWRYTRSARTAARNGFISFISGVSMLGIGLGVAALIIVLSVMNGFQKEVRDRMLSVLAHVEVFDGVDQGLADVDKLSAQLMAEPHVEATAPFVAAQGLIARGDTMRGVVLRGIDPAAEAIVTPLVEAMSPALREHTRRQMLRWTIDPAFQGDNRTSSQNNTRQNRVSEALYLIVMSPEFAVQR